MALLYWGEAELSIMLLRYSSTNMEVAAQDARIPRIQILTLSVERKFVLLWNAATGKVQFIYSFLICISVSSSTLTLLIFYFIWL
jgi:hypothetical protein